jgi:predicted PurR-regulated permease PerM
MAEEDIKSASRPNLPQGAIVSAIVFALLYFASSAVMTLLLAIVLAYFFDPVVGLLERVHVPRALGALLLLLSVMSLVGGLGYLMVERAEQFLADWPQYGAVMRKATTAIDRKLTIMEKQVESIGPERESAEEEYRPTVRVDEPRPVRELLFRSVGSLYSVLLVATFLPFLLFFMLAAKQRIWEATMELFPPRNRVRAKEALDQVSIMLRGYLAGNALVALILILASWAFFLFLHLKYSFLMGCISGLLNLIPYLGAVLAWLPPFMIGMAQWKTVGPYVGTAAMLSSFHIIGINVLMPAIVGRRVHLNALAVTVALLFWGWMWGAVGLILAVPITATIKVICDHVDGWEPVGHWLGA